MSEPSLDKRDFHRASGWAAAQVYGWPEQPARTNGYRRQRRKHGRKGWPGRKERRLASTLTSFMNWQLGLPPRTIVAVPK